MRRGKKPFSSFANLKPVRLLFVAPLFLGLLYWYINALQSRSDNDESRTIVKKSVKVGNEWRESYISSSANRLKGKNAPLVIFLHGMDGAWPNRNFTKPQYEFINNIAWKNNFIAVMPQGTAGACETEDGKYQFYYCWSMKDKRDIDYIRQLKKGVVNQYTTDPQKTFLIGFSNGGYFVVDYLLRNHQNDFTGYGIHAAGGDIFKDDPVHSYKEKFPVSLNVGKQDEYQLKPMRKLKADFLKLGWKMGENLSYSEYPATHEMSKAAFISEINFFLKK